MYVCLKCDHQLVFHKPRGGNNPCYLCPPCECLVKGCSCTDYKGTELTDRPHKDHLTMKIRWGSWGFLDFTSEDDRTFVSGAEPAVERAGLRVRREG